MDPQVCEYSADRGFFSASTGCATSYIVKRARGEKWGGEKSDGGKPAYALLFPLAITFDVVIFPVAFTGFLMYAANASRIRERQLYDAEELLHGLPRETVKEIQEELKQRKKAEKNGA
jgi:hypothetical protein